MQPVKGAAPRKLRRQEELLRQKYFTILKVVVFFLVIGAFLLLLKAWGVDTTFLVWLSQGLNWGARLGPLNLTVLNLGLAALALYLGRWFSRFIRVFLEVRSYRRAHWDDSLLYTISNTFHYVILAIAVILALGFLGVSFGDLAIVAGGLGVGIGFGLQNVVNNFISGLILLFERPIKVGDLLIIDGKWGRVKEIRVRSTIFENSDRSVLIIPNSEMLSSKIHNWTHYGPGVNRLTLKVGVSYGSDVRQVTKVLDEVCRANPRVVPEPPPQIFFEAYGDSSLNFTIWVHLKTPADRIPATHELNSAIFEAFQAQSIEIPFPQQELIVKNWAATGRTPFAPPDEEEG
jgi:small-conductance mechanosensitive channel